jgi:hypothetical protein
MSFSRRLSSLVRSMRVASCLALRACENSSVRGRYLPLGWNPGLYGADERRGAAGRGEADRGGDAMGEGDDGGANDEADRGGSGLGDAEGMARDELGVWDGVGRFELDLSSLMTELMDGTRLRSGGERGGGGERSSWRVMVDEEEGALDWAWGRRGDEGRARTGDGRGCRRRNVEDFLVVVTGRGADEEGEGESCPLVVGGSRSGSARTLGGATLGGMGSVERVREWRLD